MPMDSRLYPANWDDIAQVIKAETGWSCKQCGQSCREPGEAWVDFLKRMNWTLGRAIAARPGCYVLTVAHLDHVPQNIDRKNLKALCAPCHCRYDLSQMALKKALKRERQGQLSLFTLNPLITPYGGTDDRCR
jgi:hypothetical protein